MKKLTSLLLLSCSLALFSCGGGDDYSNNDSGNGTELDNKIDTAINKANTDFRLPSNENGEYYSLITRVGRKVSITGKFDFNFNQADYNEELNYRKSQVCPILLEFSPKYDFKINLEFKNKKFTISGAEECSK